MRGMRWSVTMTATSCSFEERQRLVARAGGEDLEHAFEVEAEGVEVVGFVVDDQDRKRAEVELRRIGRLHDATLPRQIRVAKPSRVLDVTRAQIDKANAPTEDHVIMESAEALTAKRRVLIDALMMCLTRSRVVSVVDAKTVRSVLDSAASELWREGEFRLEPVWKMLIKQPGLSAEDVAPPLLVFKAYEGELGVQVRVPQAISAIPRSEQLKLRDSLGVQRADFQRAMEEMRQIAAEETRQASQEEAVQKAVEKNEKPTTQRLPKVTKPKEPAKNRTAVVVALALVTVAGLGGGMYLGLRDSASGFDVSDVAGTLQLASAKAAQGSLSATIVDPKWETLSAEDRKKVAGQLFDQEAPKGIHTITLSDEKGATRALISDGPNGRTVVIP